MDAVEKRHRPGALRRQTYTPIVRNFARRATWFDVAGVLTFIGVGITILIEPDQMVRLVTLSDQPE